MRTGMKKAVALLLIVLHAPFLFAQEGGSAGRRSGAVFIDGFGENSVPLTSEQAISDWLNDELSLTLNLGPDDDLTLSDQVATVNDYNVRSIQQTHEGIPIVGYESRLILDAQGNRIGMVGQHEGFTGDVPTQAELSANQASQASGFTETLSVADTPVYLEIDGELRLSWQVEGRNAVSDDTTPAAERVFIDAVSGEEIARYPMVYSALTREVGDMIKACQAAGVTYPLSEEEAWPIELMVEEEEFHRSEGEASEGAAHVDTMYDVLGDAYQFM